MIDKAASADCRARMNLDSSQAPVNLGKNPCQQHEARLMHPVGGAMQQDGVEAGITEEDFDRALGRRITTENGIDLLADRSEHGA